jgi:hypothetical protein
MSQGLCTSYSKQPELEKARKLRAKTDLQLLSLIHSKLELGLNFVALVEETNSDGSLDHAEQLLRRAEQAVIEVKQLLPVLSEDQRRGFGSKLNELEIALERLDRDGERPRSNAASLS